MDYNKIDYSKYSEWQPIQTANGGVQYLVPNTEWVYDPFVSAQTGQVQLFRNPTKQVQAQAAAQKEHDDQVSLAKKQSSPMNQVMQLGLPLALAAGGKYAYNHWIDPKEVGAAQKLQDVLANQKLTAMNKAAEATLAKIPVSEGGTLGSASASSASTGTGFWGNLWGDGAASTPQATNMFDQPLEQVLNTQVAPLGTNTGSSAMARLSSEALDQAGKQALSQGAQAAGEQVAPESTGFFSGLTATAPGTVGASFLPAMGVAAGAYTGMQQFGGAKNAFQGKKLSGMQQAALALPTFGMSLLWNHIPGLTHKSTKEHIAERWGGLAEKGVNGAQEAFLAAHSPEDNGIWKEGPGQGQKWNWETAVERAKANPSEFRGAYGNFDTFGNDWATYDPSQQDAIVQRLIQENLYNPEKGDITISDKEKARKIKDEILSSDPATLMNKSIAPPTPGIPAVPMAAPSSPGISVPQLGVSPGPSPAPGASMGFKPLGIPAPGAAPMQTKTVNVPPPPPPTPVDIGKQLANRFNNKFGERY